MWLLSREGRTGRGIEDEKIRSEAMSMYNECSRHLHMYMYIQCTVRMYIIYTLYTRVCVHIDI